MTANLQTASQRSVVNAALGDFHFKSLNYIKAAQCYAQSSRGFEEVALGFNDVGESDALRYFLVKRLETMPKNVSDYSLLAFSFADPSAGR